MHISFQIIRFTPIAYQSFQMSLQTKDHSLPQTLNFKRGSNDGLC